MFSMFKKVWRPAPEKRHIIFDDKNIQAMRINLEKNQKELKSLKDKFRDQKEADKFIKSFEKDIKKMEETIKITEKAVELRKNDPQGQNSNTLQAENEARDASDSAAEEAKETNRLKDQYKANHIFEANFSIFRAIAKELSQSIPKHNQDNFTLFLNNLYYLNQTIACLVTNGDAEKASPDISKYLLELFYKTFTFSFNEEVREYLREIKDTAADALNKDIIQFPICFPPDVISPNDVANFQIGQLICADRSNGLENFLNYHPEKSSSPVKMFNSHRIDSETIFLQWGGYATSEDTFFENKEEEKSKGGNFSVQKEIDKYLNNLFHFNKDSVASAFQWILNTGSIPLTRIELITSLQSYIKNHRNLSEVNVHIYFQIIKTLTDAYMQTDEDLPEFGYNILKEIWLFQCTHRPIDLSKSSTSSNDSKQQPLTPASNSSEPKVSVALLKVDHGYNWDNKTFEGPSSSNIIATPVIPTMDSGFNSDSKTSESFTSSKIPETPVTPSTGNNTLSFNNKTSEIPMSPIYELPNAEPATIALSPSLVRSPTFFGAKKNPICESSSMHEFTSSEGPGEPPRDGPRKKSKSLPGSEGS